MTWNVPRTLIARSAALAVALALAAGPVAAADLPGLSDREIDLYRTLAKKGTAALTDGDAARAARYYRRAVRLHDGNEGTWYNLACAEARRGQTALALDALEHAREAGWTDARWPQQDSDLESVRDTVAFQQWVEAVEKQAMADETWPTPAPDTLADTEEAIDEHVEERQGELRRLAGVLGAHASLHANRELAAWRAASWDRIAASRADEDGRAEAELSALRAVTGRDATRLSGAAAREAVSRAEGFVARHPENESAGLARLAAAEARFALARAERSETAGEDFERELLLLAATEEGEAAEGALVHLFGGLGDEPARAERVLARLETITSAETARERLVAQDRGAYYKLRGLPDFEATTLDGTTVSRARLTGNVTLIDFWATWCGPCKAELPNLKATYAEFHDDGFRVVGISLDAEKDMDAEAFQAWCEENGVSWPQVYDGKGWQAALAEQFGVRSIPFPLLVDAQGHVVAADGEVRGEALSARVRAELAKAARVSGQ